MKFRFLNVKTSLGSLIALMLCACVITLPLAGCTPAQKQTTLQIVTEVNAKMPAVTAAADTVVAVVGALDPSESILLSVGDVAFDALSQTLQALTAAYIANPSATTLAQIQAAVATLEANINTATLSAVGIKDLQHQQLALAALKGLLTVVTIVFSLIAPTMFISQLYRLRETHTIHLARVRRYMDEHELQQAATEHGEDLNADFTRAEAFGF